MLRVLDLFSGIGGFSLGLERTGGFQTVAFCEIDPFCRRVLAKHWPGVPIHEDVRKLRGDDVGKVDVICGGFPCQDISTAGKGAGLAGERSGLWREYARLVGQIRPRFVIVENVAALLGRGLGTVLGDLAAIGYDAEWHCIPASAVGAPHIRDRIWIVAHPEGKRCGEARQHSQRHQERLASGGDALGNSDGPRLSLAWSQSLGAHGLESGRVPAAADWWATEPDVGRVVARLSTRLDGGRLNADAKEGGTGEILRALRNGVRQKGLRWPARGFGGVQAPEVLLASVCGYEGKARPLGHVSLARQETSAPVVRGVWFDGTTACPSCRWAAEEQRGVEHPDALRILPQLLACDCGSTWLDPAGTPSLTSRVDRLRGLGNAVVPQIVEVLGKAILQAEASAA